MGRQVCFFITDKDAEKLIEVIKMNGGIELEKTENTYFFKLSDSVLRYNTLESGKKYLDQMESEILEFRLSRPVPSKTIDFSSVTKHFQKNGFIVINDSEKYHSMMNELYKNPIYIDNPNYVLNGYEHGRIWLATQFYDLDGNIIKKSKEILSLFSSVKKYIRKNYIISINKGYYIGPDAYQKYINGEFVPRSGNVFIEFDKNKTVD